MKIVVLGAGMVGSVIARDLALDDNFSVAVADVNAQKLNALRKKTQVETITCDLDNEENLKELINDYDLVVGAVPGWMGYRTLERVINCGKNIVDISFFAEDPFQLHELALKKNVSAIIDCGVAPGCSNLILGHVNSELSSVKKFLCYVGGLPVTREYPFQYKAPFSPSDVLEEYTRPARLVEHGEIVVKPALSEPELLDFPPIGTLEAFNTDGLRSLLKTMKVPEMKEKTLRYPGHRELMECFRNTGFFSKYPVKIGQQSIRPLDFTSKIIFPHWEFLPGEEDITVMRVIIEGRRKKQTYQYTYEMIDYYDKTTNTSSMARTTGYMCSVTTRLMANGKIPHKGITPPETLGEKKDIFEAIMSGLKERGVNFQESIEEIEQ